MSDEGRIEGGVGEDNSTTTTTEVAGTAATTETFDFLEFRKKPKTKNQSDDEESTVDKYCSVISLLLFGIVTLVIIIAGVTSYRILIVVSISKIKENRTDASYHFADSISDNVTSLDAENFEKIEKLRWYCLLLGSMLAPVVLGFIGSVSSACLQSARKKGTKFMTQGFSDQQTGASIPVDRKMPLGAFAKRIIFLIFLTAIPEILHSGGMCLFVFKALPEVHTLDILPLFYATGLVPALLLLILHIKAYRQSQEKKFRDVLLDILVVLIHLGCVMFICMRWNWDSQSLRNFVPSSDLTLPTAILLISFGWWENFVNTDANNYISSPIKNFKTEMRRHRSLIYSYVMFLKMIATLCFTLGILHWNGFSVEDVQRFFTSDQSVHEIERMALISVGCILGFAALLSYISIFLTCTMGIPRFGFVCVMISMVLSAIVVFIPLCSQETLAFIERYTPDQTLEGVLRRWLVGSLSPNCDPNNPEHLWAQVGLHIGLLLSHLLLNRHVWNSLGKTAIPSLKWIFIQPLYCGILLEQSFMFRRRLPKDVDVVAEDVDPTEDVAQIPFCNDMEKNKPKVYACGTMWHESETEMRQMLASIIRLDSAVKKNDSIFDYETHIMFDDAFTTSTKTEYEQPVSSKKAATDPLSQTHETEDVVKNNPWNQKIVNNYVHNFFRIILEDILRKDVDHVIVQGVIRRRLEEALRSSNTEHSQSEAKAPATGTNVEGKQTSKGKGLGKKSSTSDTQASSPVNANDNNSPTGPNGSSNSPPPCLDQNNTEQTTSGTESNNFCETALGDETMALNNSTPGTQNSSPVNANDKTHNPPTDIDRIWVIRTPYGGRIEIKMDNTTLYVHLKDKDKIRHRKRWSQVMYMYYLLLYNTKKQMKNKDDNIDLDNVYLLALDGDVDFHADALTSLVKEMASDKKLGAACGRIHPIGSGPMVWYQKFEYAIGHWLQKSAEHVLGCVLCSPGCFSLFRGKAVMEVIDIYSNRPKKAIDYLQFDQGEDRWLCTLLLQNGRSIKYCAASDAWTYAPETFSEFYNQRRRWSVSTIANLYDLISNGWETSTINDNISFGFILYQALLLVSSLLGPATVLMAISTSITTLLIPSLSNDTAGSFVANGIIILPIIFYIWVSFTQTKNVQLKVATILSGIYALLMIATLVGIIVEVGTNIGGMSSIIFLTLVAVFVTTALLHPKELYCVLYGLIYFIAVPSMYVFLTIYSLSNLNDVSWGTRETPKHVHDNEGDSTARKVSKCSEDEFNCGSFFGCICRRKNVESHNDNSTQGESSFLPLQERRFTEGNQECPKSKDPTTATTADKQMYSGVHDSVMSGPAATPQSRSTLKEQQNGCDPTCKQSPAENNENKHAIQRWIRIRGTIFEDYTWTGAFNKYKWKKEAIKTVNLQEQNNYENSFWMYLIQFRLQPIDKNADEEILKKDLKTLRNNSMIFVLFCNAVWITFTIFVQNQTDIFIRWHDHNGYEQKSDILSLLFLSLFILVTIIQFICMLWHRFWTLILYISTAASSLKFGKNIVHPLNDSGDNAVSGTSENRSGDRETDTVDDNVGVENGRAIPPSAGNSKTMQPFDEASPSVSQTSDRNDASSLGSPLQAETLHSGATHPTYGTNPIGSLQPKDPPQTSPQNVLDPVNPLPPLQVNNMPTFKQQSGVQQTGIKHVNHGNELPEVEEKFLSSRDLAAHTSLEGSNTTMLDLPSHGKRMSPDTNQQSATKVLFVKEESGGAQTSGILKPDNIPQNQVLNNVDYSNQISQINAPDNLKAAGTADDTTSIESLSVPRVSLYPNSTVPLLDANDQASKNVKPKHPPQKILSHNFDHTVQADAAKANVSYDPKDAGAAHPTHDITLETLPKALPVRLNNTPSWSDANGTPPTSKPMHSWVSDTNIQEPTATDQNASEQTPRQKRKKDKGKGKDKKRNPKLVMKEQQNVCDPSCDQAPKESNKENNELGDDTAPQTFNLTP